MATDTENGVEAVALKALTYRWHLDPVDDPSRYNYQFAERGDTITLRPEDVDRFVELGAVTTDAESYEAQLATAGRPPAGSVGAAVIPSEAQQVRAVQTVSSLSGAGPGSTTYELMQIDTPTLRTMAKAFGVEFDENTTKQDLAEALTTRAEGVEEIQQERDQVEISNREVGGEAGMLGKNVLSGGRAADTGLPHDKSEGGAEAKKPSRSSASKE